MALYCGIDLHANNSVIAVVDEQDKVVWERRVPNEMGVIVKALEPYQAELFGCVVESGCKWSRLVDGLMDAGLEVHLAHPGAMPRYAGLKYTNDFSDARQLAHLLRLSLLPTGDIYPRHERGLRALLRRRLLLVRQKTLHHLSLQSLIGRYSGQRLSATAIKALTPDQLAEYVSGAALRGAQVTCQARCWLEAAITALEAEIHQQLRPRADYRLLQSIASSDPDG